MNEERQQSKADYYREKAARFDRLAAAAYTAERRIGDAIPFGQPILVGHHSERRHRRDIARIQRLATQQCELAEKAKYYRLKAESAAGNTAIYSHEADAVQQLRDKLAGLEAERDAIKAHNARVRKGFDLASSIRQLPEDLQKDILGSIRVGFDRGGAFPAYKLQSLGKNIQTVRERIERVQELQQTPVKDDYQIGPVTVSESSEDRRLELHFPGKPTREIIEWLKKNGFLWSPTRTCWRRSQNCRTEWLLEELSKFFPSSSTEPSPEP